MNDRFLNHLRTGALGVAPGQIMDPGIMKLPRHPARLEIDVGLDALEAEPDVAVQANRSFRHALEQIGQFVYRREPVSM